VQVDAIQVADYTAERYTASSAHAIATEKAQMTETKSLLAKFLVITGFHLAVPRWLLRLQHARH
jgi:hypothetical protein